MHLCLLVNCSSWVFLMITSTKDIQRNHFIQQLQPPLRSSWSLLCASIQGELWSLATRLPCGVRVRRPGETSWDILRFESVIEEDDLHTLICINLLIYWFIDDDDDDEDEDEDEDDDDDDDDDDNDDDDVVVVVDDSLLKLCECIGSYPLSCNELQARHGPLARLNNQEISWNEIPSMSYMTFVLF